MAKKIKRTTINPLLTLAGLGASAEVTNVSDGRDEQMLRKGIEPVKGWSRDRNAAEPSAHISASPGKIV